MFKQGISVPGLTLLYLFNGLPEKTYFTIFNEKNKDLHDLVKDNIVGGPSIIFHRYHEKGVTTLRQNEYGEAARPCRYIGIYIYIYVYIYIDHTRSISPNIASPTTWRTANASVKRALSSAGIVKLYEHNNGGCDDDTTT